MADGLGCARCGACCEVIYSLPDTDRLDRKVASWDYYLGLDDQTVAFLLALDWGWKPRRAARWRYWRHADYLNANGVREFWTREWTDGDIEPGMTRTRYTCSAYDPDRRLCTAHDLRPAICSEYPWYGRDPDASLRRRFSTDDDRAGTSCSYWLDVPGWSAHGARPLIPVKVLPRG